MNETGKEIVRLRFQGKTYREIHKLTGYSLSTICFYVGAGQKEKAFHRISIFKARQRMINKLYQYINRKPVYRLTRNVTIPSVLIVKYSRFLKRKTTSMKKTLPFTVEEVFERIGDEPKCYLTGRPVDIRDSRSYHLDHKIPVSRCGDCSLDNLGLTCAQANVAKSDMLLPEFIELCKDVLQNNGFNVVPKSS